MKVTYQGPTAIDVPAVGIVGWQSGEMRDVPGDLAEELLARGGFTREQVRARKKDISPEETRE